MKQKVIDALKDKKCISDSLLNDIHQYGFLTGSTIFGGHGPDSDIDIVIASNFPYTWKEMKEMTDYCLCSSELDYSGEELNSIYVKTKFATYNLLFINPKKIDQWIGATNIMAELCDSNDTIRELVKDKDNRVHLFETLKTMIYRNEENDKITELLKEI